MADEFERLRQEEEQRQKARKAAGHPAPWRWKPGRIGHSGTYPDGILVDANGVELLRREADDRPPPELEWVGALIAAAPEMEALLRRMEWSMAYTDVIGICPCCGCHEEVGYGTGGHRAECTLAALLARIDAAKAGT